MLTTMQNHCIYKYSINEGLNWLNILHYLAQCLINRLTNNALVLINVSHVGQSGVIFRYFTKLKTLTFY